jgi:hypothetical protein
MVLALAMLWSALPGGALAASGPSFADAQTQTAPKLARQALSQIADQLVAVRRPQGAMVSGEGLSTLEFSTLPGSAGFPGLCSAKILLVGLAYPPKTAPTARTQAHADDFSVRDVFSIVGPTDPLPGAWYDAYGRWLESACNQQQSGLGFFSATDAAVAWRAGRVMAQLLSLPATTGVEVTCADAKGDCAPRAMLARLGPSSLMDAEETSCDAQAPDGQSCMTLTFAIDRTANASTVIKLQVVLRLPQPHEVEVLKASISGARSTAG